MIKKNSSKIEPKNILREIKRHFNVVTEKIEDKISLVAEQYGDIKKDISGIKQTLDSHTDMIVSMKEDIETTKIDMADTKKDVEIIKSDIEFIKGGLKKKVDYEEFLALEKRLVLLESKMRR